MPTASVAAPAVPVSRALARRVQLAGTLAPAVVVGVLLVLVHPLLGVAGLVLVAFGAHLALRRAAVAWVGPNIPACVPATTSSAGEARALNLVESLSLALGLAPPALLVVDHDAPNLLITGAEARSTQLVLTTGALERLDRLQLEALLAHQLVLVRAGAVPVRDLLVGTLGRIGAGGAARARAAVRVGEVAADLAAIDVTRYPPALLAALQVLASSASPPPGPPALAPLWLAEPAASDELALRIAVLEEIV